MNKNSRKAFIIPLLAISAAMVLAACGGKTSMSSSSSAAATSSEAPASSSAAPESSSAAPTVYDKAGVAGDGTDFDTTIKGVTGGATGVNSFVSSDIATRTKILGSLEKYAVDNAIAGLPLYENGSYVMYQDRVVKGVTNYITGYGFGILREGNLNGTLKGATGKIKPTYYHNWEPSDPGTINALNSQDSQVSDLYANMSGSYFGVKAGASGSSYDWYGTLSNKDRPYIVKTATDGTQTASAAADSNVTSTTWRIYVRTGQTGGITYRTGSTIESRKAFDGTYATLDDYLNAYKIMLTKSNAFYRGSELASKTGKFGLVGAANYYAKSGDGMDSDAAKAAWSGVGVKTGTDATDGDYLQFTFLAPTNRFYAMYALSDSLYAPIPMTFWNLVTDSGKNPGNYGSYDSKKTTGPVDNILSTGAYYLASWEDSKSITFARNDSYKEYNWTTKAEYTNIYRIPGIYTTILAAYNTDETAAIKEFMVGNLDAAGIPQDYLDAYKNDTRTVSVPGDSVFKLNVNSTTQDQWNSLFGAKGTISQGKDGGYAVKPWMSNKDFVKGLFLSIDRNTFAATRGVIPSINYFSSNYMSDPEGGVSYNTTADHAAALTDFWGTSQATAGFSKALSQAAFDDAITKLVADGSIPTSKKLTIDVWWMYQTQITKSGTEIAGYIQDSFNNSTKAKANGLTLEVVNHAVDVWSDVYYKHLMVGQFDLGFGSITGNALDPLNFMEVLKSNNSSGFTLNWGPDTSALDLDYNNEKWSFDNLWAAADHGVVTYKGQEVKSASVKNVSYAFDANKDLTVTVKYQDAKSYMTSKASTDADAKIISELSADDYSIDLVDFYVTDQTSLYATIAADSTGAMVSDTAGVDVVSYTDGTLVVKISQDVLGSFGDSLGGFYVGADVSTNIKGIASASYDQVTYGLGAAA